MAQIDLRTGAAVALALVSAQLAPLPLPAIGLAPAQAQYGGQSVRIDCYSSGDRASSCDLPRNTQSVVFVGPDRSNRCREGETWRRRGNQIQVTGGCGGTFEAVVYQGGGQGGNWGGNQGGNWGGGNQWGNQGGFSGEVTCRSRNNRSEQCYAETEGRVQLLQQYSNSPCIQGRTWSYNRNRIEVRNGCQARFGYGRGNYSGNNGGQWGGNNGGNWGGNNGGQWGGNQGGGFAGETECRSDNNRYRRCSVNTQGRVELVRQFSSTTCMQGRNWGYDNRSIWVDNGCQARFGYGFGNQSGGYDDNRGGSNTGAIIGGAALAAGLIALLAASGRKDNRSATATAQSATLDADIGRFPSDSRTSAQACLNEAARQVGATGGSRVRLDQVDSAQRSGEGWMILAKLTGTYDGRTQAMTMDCRATGDKVTAFDVR